jgi:sugar lactone lactonase YvrE
MSVSIFYNGLCQLGESPIWHTERKSCFWVDIDGCAFYEFNMDQHAIIKRQLDCTVSLLKQTPDHHLILGLKGGIGRFNLETSELSLISDLNRSWTDHRCNDGVCDQDGALWIGTTHVQHLDASGCVYQLNKDGSSKVMLTDLTISNGMVWSLDQKRLYFIDSVTREIRQYLRTEAGLEFEKVSVRIPPSLGLPDGMAIDAEGKLWIALWGGFGVGRWDPQTGKLLEFLKVPVPHVSACAFVGDHLDKLLITTARKGLEPELLEIYPESGQVFIAEVGVRGAPVNLCQL